MEDDSSQKDQHCENSVNNHDEKSSENFQKFIYELFEKNGILGDLRAYLRGHIVNVLKNVHTGDTPMCQKHFSQRLELTYQALNILVAEYLLRLDFTYSLSVFISEIPLANMVFDLANSLLQTKTDDTYKELRFKDSDVWCVLNYLGIKCDSESASNIVYMYREEGKYPLLLCILKCLPLFHKPETFECINTSEASVSGSSKVSEDSNIKGAGKKSNSLTICKHYTVCDSCKRRMAKIQRKYKNKKEAIYKDAKSNDMIKPELFKNNDVTEKDIIEEMFEQLKDVYETEVEMVREEQERKIKRSLANHALLLQKKYDEMEESFKAREAELECDVQHRKRFLWGLARALRDQHSNMSVAMSAVQLETDRLTTKEETLQNQIRDAEHMLRKRGEEMRSQISNEMIELETRLNSMRVERDAIERERSELEKLKELCDSNTKISFHNIREREELNSKYDFLRDELSSLRKHFSSKCLVERGVMTDKKPDSNSTLNNEQEIERSGKSEDGVRTPNQVVNDLKKQKNVNFSQSNAEEAVTDRSRSCLLGGGGALSGALGGVQGGAGRGAGRGRHLESLLRDENERLKAFAEQQREHIDELAREQVRLRAELVAARLGSPRPRTAPCVTPAPGVEPSGARGACGVRRGAGEELSVFAAPRVLLPGDVIPFVGALAERRADSRRWVVSQRRSLRRAAPAGPQPRSPAPDNVEDIPQEPQEENKASSNVSLTNIRDDRKDSEQQSLHLAIEENKRREKSPKSVSREVKQKLNKEIIKPVANTARDTSPNSMLREAKRRLRKLEIEAEAVEKSYLDFKRQRNEWRREEIVKEIVPVTQHVSSDLFELQCPGAVSSHNQDHNHNTDVEVKVAKDILHNDFEKYLRDYQSKDIMKPYFANKTTTAVKIKPIPTANKPAPGSEEHNIDYINTPLNEFRKLYHNEKPRRLKKDNKPPKIVLNNYETRKTIKEDKPQIEPGNFIKIINNNEDTKTNQLEKRTESANKEFTTLKKQIDEIYGLPNDDIPCRDENDDKLNLNTEEINDDNTEDKTLLKVELDNNIETASVKVEQSDLMVVVETSLASETIRDNVCSASGVLVTPGDSSGSTGDKEIDSKSSISIKSPSSKTLHSKETPERAARLTRNDVLDAIFDTEAVKEPSSGDVRVDSGDALDALEDALRDNVDDFLADVDNYNSRSDLGHSPISQPKSSDDDIFWD